MRHHDARCFEQLVLGWLAQLAFLKVNVFLLCRRCPHSSYLHAQPQMRGCRLRDLALRAPGRNDVRGFRATSNASWRLGGTSATDYRARLVCKRYRDDARRTVFLPHRRRKNTAFSCVVSKICCQASSDRSTKSEAGTRPDPIAGQFGERLAALELLVTPRPVIIPAHEFLKLRRVLLIGAVMLMPEKMRCDCRVEDSAQVLGNTCNKSLMVRAAAMLKLSKRPYSPTAI